MPPHNITIIDQLIQTISRLPGLGPRSARRIALHLLQKKDDVLQPLIEQCLKVQEGVTHCTTCRNLDVTNPCAICANATRDASTICVVEDVADLWAIERSGMYRGQYHVLGGVLSAIDGLGPNELGIPALLARAHSGLVNEIIMATNATADGQTTAHYITDQLNTKHLKITRLAQGIPIGGELDYLDDNTLNAALQARLSV